jgi:hypothetical protein
MTVTKREKATVTKVRRVFMDLYAFRTMYLLGNFANYRNYIYSAGNITCYFGGFALQFKYGTY